MLRCLKLVSALLLINLCVLKPALWLKSQFFWPHYDLLLIALLALYLPRMGLIPVSIGLVGHLCFTLADYASEFYFGRQLYPGIDLPNLGDLDRYLKLAYPNSVWSLYAVGLMIVASAAVLIYLQISLLRSELRRLPKSITWHALVFLAALCHETHHKIEPNKSFMFRTLSFTVRSFDHSQEQASFHKTLLQSEQIFKARLKSSSALKWRPDIFLFIVESYGASSLHQNDDLSRYLVDQQHHLSEKKLYTYATNIRSPVFGGRSWLAFASLNCGAMIDQQMKLRMLYRSEKTCLSKYLKQNHYLTTEIKPATRFAPHAEQKRFYQFDRSFYRKELGYRGPGFGWGWIPDEYTMHFFINQILKPTEMRHLPIFATIAFVSSHTPWQIIPPLLQPRSFADLQFGQRYLEESPRNISEPQTAYQQSLLYNLKVILGNLDHLGPRDKLIIIVGDHPPNRQIPSFFDHHEVPLQIISSRPLHLSSHSFLSGLLPSKTPASWSFADFPSWLVEVLNEADDKSMLSRHETDAPRLSACQSPCKPQTQ